MKDPAKELSNIINKHPWLSLLEGNPTKTLCNRYPHFCKIWNAYFKLATAIFDVLAILIVLEIFLGIFIGNTQYVTKLDVISLVWAIIVNIINNKYIKKSIIWLHKNEITKIYHPKSYLTAEFNNALGGVIWHAVEVIGYALTLFLIIKYTVLICIHPVIVNRVLHRIINIFVWIYHQI